MLGITQTGAWSQNPPNTAKHDKPLRHSGHSQHRPCSHLITLSPPFRGAAPKAWGWWWAENGAAWPAGWGPGREGAATGKVWPEPPEPAAGRKESPGGSHPRKAVPGGQKARALGRTILVSGDPGMSFGTEGQALSLITRGSGWWLSHGSLCPGACGNWLPFPWLSGVSDCGPSICHHPWAQCYAGCKRGGRGGEVDLVSIHTYSCSFRLHS